MRILQAEDEELVRLSRERMLSLSLEEMRRVKKHYLELGREPTELELETLAQTWSEHCVHKTFKGVIEFGDEEVDSLFASTVARVTKELDKPWCFSVFEDNAGIVDFEGEFGVAFKVETHNHPSALEPFGGAATGVGGVIRDILGVWGDPIANTDVLCFGPLDYPYHNLPKGTKHPRFIYSYVVAGIGSYGNNMGIPTVNGAILFDKGYVGNPIVYCGTVGMVKKSRYTTRASPGDVALLVGGKTGRDGIHGVTFASAELHEESEETSGSAVQIGDPIMEEKIKRGILRVRDLGLASAITDLGGGGLSSAIGETAEKSDCGCRIYLERVSLKHPQMKPWEIWTSESQERMLLCVPKKNVEQVVGIFREEDVEATPVGEFIPEKKLSVYYKGELVGELGLDFMFKVPRIRRKATWRAPTLKEPKLREPEEFTSPLLSLLKMPNIASKEKIIRTYDHEVKAITVLKPLQGAFCDGPGDAAVLKPLYGSWKGIVISNGINPEYGKIDPYHMAASAIDEAVRNNLAVGGRRIALLDNFVWGNPEKADRLGALVRASKACYDVAIAYGTPFISGKDSLYNESSMGQVTSTLLISALGIIPDVRMSVSMDLKRAENPVYILGRTYDELGGSQYYKFHGHLGKNVPRVRVSEAKKTFTALTHAIDNGLVKACHDISDGGLGVAAAEMAFAGDVGLKLHLDRVPQEKMRKDHVLFSESNSRFLVEVENSKASEFERIMDGCVFAEVGRTTQEKELVVCSGASTLVRAELSSLKEAWQHTLR
jgi:phosphoribosylformylglycinamidine synthase